MSENGITYWVVGSRMHGVEAHTALFLERGYWEMFWPEGTKPGMDQHVSDIKPGDRIAIKKMVGGKTPDKMQIEALGIVKDVEHRPNEFHRIYIDWLLDLTKSGPKRIMDTRGAARAVNGPYSDSGDRAAWVHEVFHI